MFSYFWFYQQFYLDQQRSYPLMMPSEKEGFLYVDDKVGSTYWRYTLTSQIVKLIVMIASK